ncbi:MAG: hypothetical protein BWY99_02643 [Synergistetes bacterium ADurb.BinA166]|nr:MAG: hypothetical protein BWY99_02643 [Synergistetes bacterium ADurb.BinA166]
MFPALNENPGLIIGAESWNGFGPFALFLFIEPKRSAASFSVSSSTAPARATTVRSGEYQERKKSLSMVGLKLTDLPVILCSSPVPLYATSSERCHTPMSGLFSYMEISSRITGRSFSMSEDRSRAPVRVSCTTSTAVRPWCFEMWTWKPVISLSVKAL